MAVVPDFGPNSLAPPTDGPAPHAPDRSKRFLLLFLQNQRPLYAYILTLLPHRADADDVLQDTSLTMWDKFDAAEPPTDFLAWGRRIAFHKVLDFNKKSHRAQSRLSQLFLERVSASAAQDAALFDARREALARCLEKLGERDRDLLTRRFADGATTQSTSEHLGRSIDAVYKRLAKIRHGLFECVRNALAREERA
jgi:RNA polymerase sigma-70 factor (ECF subfamily)